MDECQSCRQAPDCGIKRCVEALEGLMNDPPVNDGWDRLAVQAAAARALNARSQCCEGYLKMEE